MGIPCGESTASQIGRVGPHEGLAARPDVFRLLGPTGSWPRGCPPARPQSGLPPPQRVSHGVIYISVGVLFESDDAVTPGQRDHASAERNLRVECVAGSRSLEESGQHDTRCSIDLAKTNLIGLFIQPIECFAAVVRNFLFFSNHF